MIALLAFIVAIALAIVFAGGTLGHVLASPETRALTRLVSAHRFEGPLAQAESVGGIFSLYGLDASGRRDAKPSELKERRERLLADAAIFDMRYGKFHWGVRAKSILEQELGQRLDEN